MSDGRVDLNRSTGAKVGDSRPYTTAGTYSFRNAVAAVKVIAKETGGRTFSISGCGVAVVDGDHPPSVYVAFQGSNHQSEVFEPSAGRALRHVRAGRVVRVR
jgi:hypothetical protein